TVTFTPEPSFVGKAPAVTVVREDMNGTKASATYTPTVTPVTPAATPAESVAPQGIVQTGTVTFTAGNPVAPINKQTITLLDENGKPAESVDAKSPEGKVIGKFTVDKETGVVTFTPTDKSYSGEVVPVKVQAKDANGTTVETTYTPKITPVAPTADPAESIGKQGQEQTGKPTFTPGNPAVPMNDDTPATFEDGKTTKTVDGVGTYTVAPDGTVTFKPVPSFVGEAPSVTVVREDMNGTKVSAKYTPTVTPVRPTGEEVTSEDIQGKTQTGKPTFTEGDPVVPMDDSVPATFEDGSTTKTIPGEGTYTVSPDGTVTFVPEKSFTGKGTGVTVVRVDKNGTKASAKYTPTVIPVTPTADPAESTGVQGQEQTGKPTFNPGNPEVPMDDEVPATFEDGKTTKKVDGVGTYTVAPDGTVTFKPVPSFVGKAPAVTVVRVDKNGTKASATYTPTVTPVTPTSEDVTSTDVQGKTQTGTPVFTPGNPAVPMDDKVPATFEDGSTTKKVDGEGTYTVSPDGTVTFVPEKSFTGTATGVTVKRVDKNGTAITAKYTPTVTPVTPTGEPAESIGPKGQEQTGKPTFTPGNPEVPMNDEVPATFEDGSKTKKVDGVGTYTVAKDGTVTFKPEPEFVGKAPSVTVVREDKNGTKVSATYTPTVTPSTKYVDNKGNAIPGYPEVDGTVEKKDIPGYTYVGTKTDEKGNTTHIYEKVVTPVPAPTPNEPVKPVVPSVEKVEKAKPKAKTQAKRLANTGEAETHSTLAGFGLLVLGGLVAAARRRKEK
ncbi:LPXTG cell wall anchor domain-containing protein, partial [Gemella sanguinis]|uniref:LPXTG cell wall anchor domain-containing protein n=2 Tax=Gemella sanguinis TaxID=84135 RepID=UPI00144406BC